MAVDKLNLSSPWVCYYRELETMFWSDPDVHVIFDEDGPRVKLYVDNPKKSAALEMILNQSKEFGNVTLSIDILPANAEEHAGFLKRFSDMEVPVDIVDLICSAFRLNPAFCYCKKTQLGPYAIHYVVFKNCVVQYFNDDLGDVHGLCSTLYQTIAKNICQDMPNVFFCTNLPSEPFMQTTQFGLPLGEWP